MSSEVLEPASAENFGTEVSPVVGKTGRAPFAAIVVIISPRLAENSCHLTHGHCLGCNARPEDWLLSQQT
eukprot:CAMPEP_0177433988 /NCGR_PEP_ID=MMETSP0369-20130122/149_1 /TAXON_ID=447022 ORGANISM="Scrippsiella hangoei-like, Strain SHHI-4" /NCGR_SAMPLE_ID=MMETSP0369 /ASSEMBLY_ACC=CAM_ASM_000364 /LENGTH=69 /DNA_ID=CAMNT_0018904793 /DNA_START=394 /DNA_END=599 /DNA_ORIENTATION=+